MPKLQGHFRDSSCPDGHASAATSSENLARNPMLHATLKRLFLLAVLVCATMPNSGCKLLFGFTDAAFVFADFWQTTPLIPVTPYMSQQVEDTYWEEERYGKVPILDPVEGEHAPLFCLDPPYPDEVEKARLKIMKACKDANIAFLDVMTKTNVEQRIREGVKIVATRYEESAAEGRRLTKRPQPW